MRTRVAFELLLLAVLGGCAVDAKDPPTTEENTNATSQAIINGSASPASQDVVVQLALDNGAGPQSLCSATLVAKNLVLTARHCVGQVDEAQQNVTNFAASRLRVYTGQTSPQKIAAKAAPAAIGKKLFTAAGTTMIPDIALILLDRSIENPVATIRLDGGAKVDEPLTIVGYGLTQDNVEPTQRMQRTGKKVKQVAPATIEGEPLNDGEFTFTEAACSGDSGGPALHATTGAVIGVASRVGNGVQPTPTNPSAFCVGENTLDFYTALAPAKSFITAAFKEAGATPKLETATEPDSSADDEDTSTKTSTKKSSTASDEDEDGDTSSRPKLSLASSGCSVGPGRHEKPARIAIFEIGLVALTVLRRRRA